MTPEQYAFTRQDLVVIMTALQEAPIPFKTTFPVISKVQAQIEIKSVPRAVEPSQGETKRQDVE